jgi:hypothetical protein
MFFEGEAASGKKNLQEELGAYPVDGLDIHIAVEPQQPCRMKACFLQPLPVARLF